MRYKCTNWFPPTKEGELVRLEVVYDTFEELVDKIVKDLNSFWKKMLPQNITFNIKTVSPDTPTGLRYLVGDKIMAKNHRDVELALEELTRANRDYWGDDQKEIAGMHDEESMKNMRRLMAECI